MDDETSRLVALSVVMGFLCVRTTRARNEIEARDALARIWSDPARSAELLDQLAIKNANVFEFEKTLEEKEDIPEIVMTVRS